MSPFVACTPKSTASMFGNNNQSHSGRALGPKVVVFHRAGTDGQGLVQTDGLSLHAIFLTVADGCGLNS